MPCSGPRIAFNKDVLRGGAGGADAVDSGLVKTRHERVVHVVVLVVGVEDDLGVVLEAGGHCGPPGLEAGRVGNDLFVVATCIFPC
jgi:hypothetical protein